MDLGNFILLFGKGNPNDFEENYTEKFLSHTQETENYATIGLVSVLQQCKVNIAVHTVGSQMHQ